MAIIPTEQTDKDRERQMLLTLLGPRAASQNMPVAPVDEHRDPEPLSPMNGYGSMTNATVDMFNRPLVNNADGSRSTLYSESSNTAPGVETLYPRVADDGRFMSSQEAADYAAKTGKNLGTFATPEAADAAAVAMHNYQEAHPPNVTRTVASGINPDDLGERGQSALPPQAIRDYPTQPFGTSKPDDNKEWLALSRLLPQKPAPVMPAAPATSLPAQPTAPTSSGQAPLVADAMQQAQRSTPTVQQPVFAEPPAQPQTNDRDMKLFAILDTLFNRGASLNGLAAQKRLQDQEAAQAADKQLQRQKTQAEIAHLNAVSSDPYGLNAINAQGKAFELQRKREESDPNSETSKRVAAAYAEATGKDPKELVGVVSASQIKDAQGAFNGLVTSKREGENFTRGQGEWDRRQAAQLADWKLKNGAEYAQWVKKFGQEVADRRAQAVFTSELATQREIAAEERKPAVAAAVKAAETFPKAKESPEMQTRMDAWERLHPDWKIQEPTFWSEAETNGRGRTKYLADIQQADLLRTATRDIAKERDNALGAVHSGNFGDAYSYRKAMLVAVDKAAGALNKLTGGGGTKEEREKVISEYPALSNPFGEGALAEIDKIFTDAASTITASYGVVPREAGDVSTHLQADNEAGEPAPDNEAAEAAPAPASAPRAAMSKPKAEPRPAPTPIYRITLPSGAVRERAMTAEELENLKAGAGDKVKIEELR